MVNKKIIRLEWMILDGYSSSFNRVLIDLWDTGCM